MDVKAILLEIKEFHHLAVDQNIDFQRIGTGTLENWADVLQKHLGDDDETESVRKTKPMDEASAKAIERVARLERNMHLHLVRSYAAQLRRVAEMYEELERLANQPGSELAHLLKIAGAMATSGLSKAADLLSTIFQGLELDSEEKG